MLGCPKCLNTINITRKIIGSEYETYCPNCEYYDDSTKFVLPKLSLREIYKVLFETRKQDLIACIPVDNFYPIDTINRKCNLFAVQNTVRVWRNQWKN